MLAWTINEWAAFVTIAAVVLPSGYKAFRTFVPSSKKFLPRQIIHDAEYTPQCVVVPAGKVKIGSPESELEREASYEYGADEREEYRGTEGPQKVISFSRQFAIGIYPVKVSEFRAYAISKNFQGGEALIFSQKYDGYRASPVWRDWEDPGFQQRDDHPVVGISWIEAKDYCDWLTVKTGKKYRLPTASEWEYAARAGAEDKPFWWGDYISPSQANYNHELTYAESSDKRKKPSGTCPVQSYSPNSFGLYQVHGNVWEHCEDTWSQNS